MTFYNPNVDLVNAIKCVYKIWLNFVHSILRYGAKTAIKGRNSVANFRKMTLYNPELCRNEREKNRENDGQGESSIERDYKK